MSINFASASYFTKASCSSVCSDGFEVSNLISDDLALVSKGFQGERFVRTPITVQFNFYIPISVHRIDLVPWVGRQCVKVIHIHFSGASPCAGRSLAEESALDVEDDSFKKVGTAVLTVPTKLSFVNRGYRPHRRLHEPTSFDGISVNLHGYLDNTTSIRIVMAKMLRGSIPSLCKVRIWGKPARFCNLARSKEILAIYNHNVDKTSASTSGGNMKATENTVGTNLGVILQGVKQTDAFPKEFIDPLTCEVMRAPVLLPSGHTIDRKTLEKHVASQAEVGNVPSDPYTGIPFTDSSKPLPNVELKIRMDNYAFKDCSEKTTSLEPRSEESLKRKLSFEGQIHKKSKTELEPISAAGHVADLSSSLNGALHEAQNRKREVNSKRILSLSNTLSKSAMLFCACCSDLLYSGSAQYRLPCAHFLCRKCIQTRNRQCPKCLVLYQQSEVERFHCRV